MIFHDLRLYIHIFLFSNKISQIQLSSAITVRLYVCHEIIGLCNTVYLFSSKKRLRLHGSFWTRDKGSSRDDRISIFIQTVVELMI